MCSVVWCEPPKLTWPVPFVRRSSWAAAGATGCQRWPRIRSPWTARDEGWTAGISSTTGSGTRSGEVSNPSTSGTSRSWRKWTPGTSTIFSVSDGTSTSSPDNFGNGSVLIKNATGRWMAAQISQLLLGSHCHPKASPGKTSYPDKISRSENLWKSRPFTRNFPERIQLVKRVKQANCMPLYSTQCIVRPISRKIRYTSISSRKPGRLKCHLKIYNNALSWDKKNEHWKWIILNLDLIIHNHLR